jgi:hypothetical protein
MAYAPFDLRGKVAPVIDGGYSLFCPPLDPGPRLGLGRFCVAPVAER